MSLSVSDLVNVQINLSPLSAIGRSFGTLMIAGDSNVINGLERFRTYTTLAGVAADFGTSAPEYKAAALYFGQTPQPQNLMIGRWVRTASSGENIGGILSPIEQALSNFTSITNGGFDISIDGSAQNLTGLNFSAATNLNGVASAINAVLTGAICSWDGEEFNIVSNSTGAGAYASGTITFNTAPSASDTVSINGQTITFVSSSPAANQVLIVSSDPVASAANLQAFLQSSADSLLTPFSYSTAAGIVTITDKTIGIGGNSVALAKSSTHLTLSASTLLGGAVPSSVGFATTGAGTDVSSLLQLTASLSQGLASGYNAEQPVDCASVLANMSPAWYGLMFQASVQPTDDQNIDVCTFIEGQSLTRIFGVTIVNTNVLSSIVSSDLASRMMAGGYLQCFNQYSENAYAIASMFGRAFSVDFTQNNSTITLMYKQEPSVAPENLTESQAAVLKSKRCNVFVQYVNNTSIIQQGVMSGSAFFDEIQGLDWLQDAIQTACFNVLYTSSSKVPQTDAGVNQLTNAIAGACNEGVNNGLIAPGVWNAAGFGSLQQGQYLKNGYYIFAESVALQSESDRSSRVAPPIQVAVKLAGAIQSVNVLVNVNR